MHEQFKHGRNFYEQYAIVIIKNIKSFDVSFIVVVQFIEVDCYYII